MIQRNRADQDVRAGGVFVEGTEKIGFPGFGFFRQGNNYALRGRKRLSEGKMQLRGSKDGGWEYTNNAGESKMEISIWIVDVGEEDKAEIAAIGFPSQSGHRLS